jgi:hypothetical protein
MSRIDLEDESIFDLLHLRLRRLLVAFLQRFEEAGLLLEVKDLLLIAAGVDRRGGRQRFRDFGNLGAGRPSMISRMRFSASESGIMAPSNGCCCSSASFILRKAFVNSSTHSFRFSAVSPSIARLESDV